MSEDNDKESDVLEKPAESGAAEASEGSSPVNGAELGGECSGFERWKARRAAKKEEKRRKEQEKSTLQNVLELVAFTAGALCVALIIKNYIGQPIIVDGDSMNDTLENHQVVWANKVNYEPERFDVVIILPYEGQDTLYIKRVIALPGETIYIDEDEKIHITPADSDESYILEDKYGYFSGEIRSKVIMYPNNEDGSYTLGEDEYFCMGDNRHNSKDSRLLGAFSSDQIKGHAVCRIWPLTKLGNFDKSNEE
ncbi:MAG: signal peptidase I [Lachnospiraceae bacterium]